MSGVDLILKLAERLKTATKPDRDLDAAISLALGWVVEPIRMATVSPWTSSIDYAKMLVPLGWWWSVGDCSVSSDASVGPDVAHCDKATLIRFDNGVHVDLPHPSTPALALAAASLMGRAAIQGEG